MKLLTSNPQKIEEYNRFGLGFTAVKGNDIDEVDADMLTVALYKAIDIPDQHVIEDTSLDIDGEDVGVNIRWLEHRLEEFHGKKAQWHVVLAMKDNGFIKLYSATQEGVIDYTKYDERGIGFDSVFVPEGSDKSLYELNCIDEKDNFSPRKFAAQNLINDDFALIWNVNYIPEWKGKWQ